MAVYSSHPLKRTSSTAELDTPAAKKLNRGPFRHHRPLWDLQREQRLNTLWQDQEAAQSTLTRSISLALHAVGFEAADPVAIESFRCDVEEYMSHYLADVRQSMLACRRTQPLPQDFLQALHTHQLSLRSLLPHLDPPVPPSQSQFSLESAPIDNDEQQQLKFLGPLLNGTQEQKAKKFVPKHFPDLPSTHTYKATPEFPDREQDPRKVRERATEEGRLGEEALRRLVGAGSRHPAYVLQQRPDNRSLRAKRAQMWMETMHAVETGASDKMDMDAGIFTGKGQQKEGDPDSSLSGDSRLSSVVNSEKRYWRKPGAQRREASGSIARCSSVCMLLRSLQGLEAHSNPPLGFSALDRILDVFQNPPITRQQQQYHMQWSTELQETQQTSPLAKNKPPPVIEITGATACSGKTQLLYHLISISLLPVQYRDTANVGKGYAVVLLDLSSKFSILRLYDVMYDRVTSICSTDSFVLPHAEISSLVSDSLTHLHIFRPQESSSLQATLDSISSYLLHHHSLHVSANRPLGLIAMNDLSAFLWQDRLDADEESEPSTTTRKEKANNSLLLQRYRRLVSSLRHTQQLFSCPIVATNWSFAPTTSVANHRSLRPHLPSVWNSFCTVKLIVERDRVPKFGPGMSAEEAANERQQRWGAVEQSGFSGRINWWGGENWRDEVGEGLGSLARGGSFQFKVTNMGIIVDDSED